MCEGDRHTHVHYRLRDRLLSDYPERLKSDNIVVLKKLSEFFAMDNIESKYGRYLEFTSTAYFLQATGDKGVELSDIT
jgi:hypothetical protein